MQVAFRTIGIVGAAGRMGTRVRTRLAQRPELELLLVDVGKGAEQLQQEGLHVVSGVEAAQRSDVLVLAVPDNKIAAVAQELVPFVRSGCAVLYLDPAVPFAGVLP
jgi:prephenate dehydrogenase